MFTFHVIFGVSHKISGSIVAVFLNKIFISRHSNDTVSFPPIISIKLVNVEKNVFNNFPTEPPLYYV